MIPYEKEQLEKAAERILKAELRMNSWITAIKAVQDECGIVRQMIYNTLNHESIKNEQD